MICPWARGQWDHESIDDLGEGKEGDVVNALRFNLVHRSYRRGIEGEMDRGMRSRNGRGMVTGSDEPTGGTGRGESLI